MVKLSAFKPFGSAADALEQVNAISESQLTDELKSFLEMNLPKVIPLLDSSCMAGAYPAYLPSRCVHHPCTVSPAT